MMIALQRAQLFMAHLFIERPASFTGFDRIIQRLEVSGASLVQRAASAGGRTSNQTVLAHIIGIERWGQRRLNVAFGEPLTGEGYERYLPSAQDWQDLLEMFRAARRDTVSLSKTLRMVGVDPRQRIPHEQFGELSLLGWLYYLHLHASLASIRIS